jgi:hypothetical protein
MMTNAYTRAQILAKEAYLVCSELKCIREFPGENGKLEVAVLSMTPYFCLSLCSPQNHMSPSSGYMPGI